AIHFGILNSLRTWNFYDLPNTVTSFSNVGGFGIDGGVSTLLGASLANPNKLYYGVIGDLAFFYDLNAIGNRHTANNLRILLVNNGKGTEFRMYNHHAAHFGSDGDES
ncbi:2-succinyl-5-enolpyruvyl-6-hydroxy-3-cyclohexene-1-carboxylate synthase, partial [Enterobacter cloacae complex sp.6722794]